MDRVGSPTAPVAPRRCLKAWNAGLAIRRLPFLSSRINGPVMFIAPRFRHRRRRYRIIKKIGEELQQGYLRDQSLTFIALFIISVLYTFSPD